jgi:hypothetical protein
MLEPVQRALAGERGAVLASGLEPAGEGREHWVVAQLIVVDEILIAERDAEHVKRRPEASRPLQCYGGSVELSEAEWHALARFRCFQCDEVQCRSV